MGVQTEVTAPARCGLELGSGVCSVCVGEVLLATDLRMNGCGSKAASSPGLTKRGQVPHLPNMALSLRKQLRKLSKSTIMLSEYLATTTSVTLLFILMPREQMCVCEGLGGGDSKGRVQVWTQPPGSWPLQGATCFLYCQAHLIGVQVP